MQKALWAYSFGENWGPNYPCPYCKSGTLRLRKESLQRTGALRPSPTKLSDAAFFCALDCSACQGSVSVVGYIRKDNALVPRGIYPAPPIISIPPQAPRTVVNELELAFSLFWVDLSSCANKIRVSLERLLDFLQVPEAKTLAVRIMEFEKKAKDEAEVFHALREVGNVGSHGSDTGRKMVLDTFEMYEIQLQKIFDTRDSRLKLLTARIREAHKK